MRNKYFILAVTFLCLFVGQQSYGQDYDYGGSTIDNIVSGLLRLNPEIDVDEYSDYQSYVNDVNNDFNPDNDFSDMNGDGSIDISDNLYQQNLANTLGLPKTTNVNELENLVFGAIEANKRNSAIEYNNYANPENIDYGYFSFDSTGALTHWVSVDAYIDFVDSGNSSAIESSSVGDKIKALAKAALITELLTKPLVIGKALESYALINILGDSSCNDTNGGCQSWFKSNFIGASSSGKTAQRQHDEDGINPIDIVDLAAYNHDVAYDNLGAAGAASAAFDLNTLPADKNLVDACYDAVSMYYSGGIDSITGEPVSLVTKERALLVIAAFEIVVTEKELRN